MSDFLQAVRDRVVIYDGAMGTSLQKHNPTVDDYEGQEGCTEILTLTHPEWLEQTHASFFEVGCDVVETNTFGATSIVLAEFDLADKVAELNHKAVAIARRVANDFSKKGRPRFVAGSMGPTTKLPSLGHIGFDEMAASYQEQAEALIEAGIDVFLIETCQDILQVKSAVVGVFDAMEKLKKRIPVTVQVTIEATGTMLLGTEVGAALTTLAAYDVDIVGINCATGPKEMNDAVRFLGHNSAKPVSVLPNAGLPENVGGEAVYHLTSDELADYHARFISEYGVRIVGGCCGTTPEHLKSVVDRCANLEPAAHGGTPEPSAASAYAAVPFDLDPKPLVVAEEMNTTTQKAAFRKMVQEGRHDDILSLAKKLVSEGSHMLDLCTAIVGEDEKGYMCTILEKIATRVPAPILVDSTEADVIEEALKRIPGKAVINSINLEDGEKRTSKVLPMARRYGAAVIALTIDEEGMALTADRKVAIAKRIYELATEKYRMNGSDLIFDALTLPISTGQEDYRTAGIETLNAVKRIKAELPGVHTLLGVSNISFGLSAYSRRVLNSVFTHEAVEHGLDMAIVNYAKIYPLYKIPEVERELALKLIYNAEADGAPLQDFINHFAGMDKKEEAPVEELLSLSIEDKLQHLIISGEKAIGEGKQRRSLEDLLEEALEGDYSPLDVINNVLLEGMKTVGELFGARKMQLPSVLDSAGVMKQAVAHLEPMMERTEGQEKGTLVLATVKGDVHDIGKNLVDIILTNNGYKVVNLGIKQPSDPIIAAAKEHNASAIGLSGLLVKSTLEMKYVLQDLQQQGHQFPVICGGAALTRKYVEVDLRNEYSHGVFYGTDAFVGLSLMDQLTGDEAARTKILDEGREPTGGTGTAATAVAEAPAVRSTAIAHDVDIPAAPFYGVRVKKDYDLNEVFGYINETALFKNQWQLKTASQGDYLRIVEEKYRPILNDLQTEVINEGWFEPKVVYGYFPCHSEGNDLIVYSAPEEGWKPGEALPEIAQRFTFPRQREGRKLCVADFFTPKDSGQTDVIGFSVVTIGDRATHETQRLFEHHEYTKYLYLHGLSVETAEALAELLHKQMRAELGMGGDDSAAVKDLFHQKYRGSRFSLGYPACPNLEDQTQIFELLDVEEAIGVRLTSSFLLEPEQSTSAIIAHHPDAKYFVV